MGGGGHKREPLAVEARFNSLHRPPTMDEAIKRRASAVLFSSQLKLEGRSIVDSTKHGEYNIVRR